MFDRRKGEALSLCYPRCFGLVCVQEDRLWEGGVIPFSAQKDKSNKAQATGLLFEYLEDLKEITKDMITPVLAEGIKTALASIHALNIRHNDIENHSAFPDVGFGNLFIKEGTSGRSKSQFERGISVSRLDEGFLDVLKLTCKKLSSWTSTAPESFHSRSGTNRRSGRRLRELQKCWSWRFQKRIFGSRFQKRLESFSPEYLSRERALSSEDKIISVLFWSYDHPVPPKPDVR
jgi:hypothetical protein